LIGRHAQQHKVLREPFDFRHGAADRTHKTRFVADEMIGGKDGNVGKGVAM
jgi:hypothetical protein